MAKYNKFEKYFRNTVDFLNSIGAEYFVHGSTLLGKVRNDCLINREDVMHDKELNFGMLAPDYTKRIHDEIKYHNEYFDTVTCELPKILTFFSNLKRPDPPKPIHPYETKFNPWNLPAFSLITLYWEGKTKAIEYMGQDIALTWPKEHVFNKDKWETLEMAGKEVKAPYQKEKFLSHYFGEDYMTEKKKWHYSQDSCNKESFKELVEGGEIDVKSAVLPW